MSILDNKKSNCSIISKFDRLGYLDTQYSTVWKKMVILIAKKWYFLWNIVTNFNIVELLELFLIWDFESWNLEKNLRKPKAKISFFDPDHIWRVFQLCHIHTWDTWHKCCCDTRHNTSYKTLGICHLSGKSKVGCVCPMVIVSMLNHAKFGRNDQWKYAPHFTIKSTTCIVFRVDYYIIILLVWPI